MDREDLKYSTGIRHISKCKKELCEILRSTFERELLFLGEIVDILNLTDSIIFKIYFC